MVAPQMRISHQEIWFWSSHFRDNNEDHDPFHYIPVPYR